MTTEIALRPNALLPATREEAKEQAELELQIASDRAKLAADIIEQRKLYTVIEGKKHVHVEGWVTLARLYRYVPDIEWTRPVEGGGWEARAKLIDAGTGAVVAHGEHECGTRGDTKRWMDASSYAQKSMAQTRAVGKVCRLTQSWIMVLAGYSPTPAEEMEAVKQKGPVGGEQRRFIYDPPTCPKDGADWKFVPAGMSKAGKKYGAFHACSTRGCDARPESITAAKADEAIEAEVVQPEASSGGGPQSDRPPARAPAPQGGSNAAQPLYSDKPADPWGEYRSLGGEINWPAFDARCAELGIKGTHLGKAMGMAPEDKATRGDIRRWVEGEGHNVADLFFLAQEAVTEAELGRDS